MKEENRCDIYIVLHHLQKRDPDWKHVKMLPKFKTIYQGWADGCVRHHIHSRVYFSRKWKDGWVPFMEFREFFNYAME